MSEQAYFEQFSGHKPTDDCYWDTWLIICGDFVHWEYGSEQEAKDELARIKREETFYSEPYIERIEKAGFGDMRLKIHGMRIWPIGGMDKMIKRQSGGVS